MYYNNWVGFTAVGYIFFGENKRVFALGCSLKVVLISLEKSKRFRKAEEACGEIRPRNTKI